MGINQILLERVFANALTVTKVVLVNEVRHNPNFERFESAILSPFISMKAHVMAAVVMVSASPVVKCLRCTEVMDPTCLRIGILITPQHAFVTLVCVETN